MQQSPDGFMVIVPADHKIADHQHFQAVVEQIARLANEDRLGTLGIASIHSPGNWLWLHRSPNLVCQPALRQT